jgi:hypothetical protein
MSLHGTILFVLYVLVPWSGVMAVGYALGPVFRLDPFLLGLPGVYVVWLCVLAALYPPCRAFAALKRRRREWWWSYL